MASLRGRRIPPAIPETSAVKYASSILDLIGNTPLLALEGKVIVCMLCDSGERYLSVQGLFNSEEWVP